MTRFAKLPLALLAVLAMLFLMPGPARADDVTGAAGSSATATSTDSASSAAATTTTTGSDTATTPTQTRQNAAVPNLPTTPFPPPPCETTSDLPHCTPDCAFLAQVLHQDICTTLPQCLPGPLPQDFPAIPGIPVCESSTTPPPPSTSPGGVYYKNCADARAHGASNIHRGQPGYRSGLDRDHDGIACETSTSSATPTTPAAPIPKPQPVAAPAVGQLAYTGAVPAPVALAGFGLVLGGAGLLRLSRRPR